MKRRDFIAVGMLCAAQLALCGCDAQPESQLPQLKIGYSEYKPYIFVGDDGEVSGSDAQLAREACKRMGYEPVFVEVDWQDRDRYLASGEVDCLWSCFSMDNREDKYAWAGPYMMSREVVAVLEGSVIETLADLKGKRVAVKATTKPESIFLESTDRRIPKVENVYCLTSAEEMVIALRNEYVDACAGHAAALRYCLQAAEVAYRFLEEDLLHVRLGVAFAKDGDGVLCQKLNAAFDEMIDDGTEKAIFAQCGFDVDKVLEGIGDE